jgi:hypothetical protein
MASTTDVPVTITPEASAHVAELGLQTVFERILDRARQTIPGLLSLTVTYQPGYEGEIPCVLIEAESSAYEAANKAAESIGLWRVTEIPPQQGQHFMLWALPEYSHER